MTEIPLLGIVISKGKGMSFVLETIISVLVHIPMRGMVHISSTGTFMHVFIAGTTYGELSGRLLAYKKGL